MIKDGYILNAIEEIKDILQKNDYRKTRYNKDIDWLEERKELFNSNIIRIAIMGVTSSGKSTLVNALLGERILPMAIRPSSSIIITASKGLNREAIIYFNDKKPKILKEDDLNEDTISEYADENKNPNNELKVTQIHITTPSFLLDENIHIIDSPGLDAWNLENHEKLTLEILLPTIDICIFVTTVKANSDGTNAEKIKIVDEKEKQIILVQNMIDSVEEKIGKNGIIEEDKITILKKHKNRAENLLNKATQGKEKFEVIQISALNGLNGIINDDNELYKKSNLEGFIRAVEICTEKTMPKIDMKRAVSLKDKIKSIINTDKEIVKGNDLEAIQALAEVKSRDIDKLVYDFENAQEKILLKIKDIEEVISGTISEITESTSEDFEDYLNIVDRINNKKLYIESDIINVVKDCENRKKDIYDKLNLDIRFSYSLPNIESKNIEIKHRVEEKTMLFKKDGVFNKGKRFLSNLLDKEWGYKEVEYDEKIIDKDATKKMAKDICNENKISYINILKEWGNQFNKSIEIFYSEAKKRTEEYNEKKDQNIELFDLDDVSRSLSVIKDMLEEFKLEEKDEVAIAIDEPEQKIIYQIPKEQYNFYVLSNKVLEQNYLLVGQYIRQKCSEKVKNSFFNLFWTWDIDSCNEFIFRTYGNYLSKNECERLKEEGLLSIDNLVIAYELCKNNKDFYNKVNTLKDKSFNMFILFNGIQIGNSKKQILESRNLLAFFKNSKNIMLNLVIDSSREFINANNVQELLFEVENLKNSIKNRYYNVVVDYVLINAKNPIYNMALIESIQKGQFLISDYKNLKEKLFENPLARGIEEKEILEAILSYYLNRNCDADFNA